VVTMTRVHTGFSSMVPDGDWPRPHGWGRPERLGLPLIAKDTVKELRKESKREGMEGISPRYVQDKISNALVNDAARVDDDNCSTAR